MDEEKLITLKDGRQVRLIFNESNVTAYDTNNKKIGCVGFNVQWGDLHDHIPDIISLYDADVDVNYRRQGIARECVIFAQEITGIDIIIAPHFTDTMKNNGNYLTDDGSALIESLRKQGIVRPHQNDSPE